MSSTNRGYDRHKSDYYITPQSVVSLFLDCWLSDLQNEEEYNFIAERPDKVRWLDPCAGGDDNHEMSYAETIKRNFEPSVLDTQDIREDSKAETKADYLLTQNKGYDIIITNPPFDIAREIIIKAQEEVNEGGYVVMLLRLNFLGSKDRKVFFEDNMPERIYVHSKRICFTEDGATDSIEYAHFVWKKGLKLKESKLKII